MATLKFTTSATQEGSKKIDSFNVLNQLFLNFQFNISNLAEILIVFKAFPTNDVLHKNESFSRLRRKTKTLELYLVLDYERIMQGSDEENLQHIKEVFLKGCETFLKPMKGFRWEEFEEQLKQIL